ncbi:RraA family protein [Paracoccus litorisediminis]|uniref:RraA family protein n=1 Tax=Paracoccus litorisediminis TaxID=2006130 RepID=UPI0014780916|nr:hypothetical protein [Paracoccus litorisediminis]
MADAINAIATRLGQLPVALLSDTLEAAGLPDQVLSPALRPLTMARRFAGPAACLSGRAGPGPGLAIDAVDTAVTPGSIVVIGPANGCDMALAGGNMISAWRRRGAAAVITDGRLRDAADYPELPALARGHSPRNCRGAWHFIATDRPIPLAGAGPAGRVTIHPGDWLVGDEDGVIVLPRAQLSALIEDAGLVAEIEEQMRAQIFAGAARGAVYAGHDRFGHVRRA